MWLGPQSASPRRSCVKKTISPGREGMDDGIIRRLSQRSITNHQGQGMRISNEMKEITDLQLEPLGGRQENT